MKDLGMEPITGSTDEPAPIKQINVYRTPKTKKRVSDRQCNPAPPDGGKLINRRKPKGYKRLANLRGHMGRQSVMPIRSREDIEKIKANLLRKKSKRDYALFVIGINTNLRGADLLRLTIAHVRHATPGRDLILRETKTGNRRIITVNNTVYDAIQMLLKELGEDAPPERNLFLSKNFRHKKRNRRFQPISYQRMRQIIIEWCDEIGLEGQFGCHTLRKTWGYHAHHTFGVPLPEIMWCFGHSTQRQTLDYLSFNTEDIRKVYLNEL